MVVIKNANIEPVEGGVIENGIIAIEKGKITYVGKTLPNKLSEGKAIKYIDAKGHLVTPGLIDPHSHVGIGEEGIGWEGRDYNEMSDPITPEMRGFDGIYFKDEAFINSARAGITSVVTGPGSANLIGGTFCALKTYATNLDSAIITKESHMKMALGENPKRVYGSSYKKAPYTRMACASMIRTALIKASEYKMARKEKPNCGYDASLESLSRVFDDLPVKIHAHRSDDIESALRIIKEFNLNATIEHASEAHLITKELKDANVDVIIGPTLSGKSKYELKNLSFDSAKILEKAGVRFAIMTDAPIIPSQNALVQAALFIKNGASRKVVLEALTINAAILNNIDSSVGSIKVGKDADIVIWDKDLFDIQARPLMVFVNGKLVK